MYVITHSLLYSWLYALKENPYEDMTTEHDKMDDFMKSLRREPIETTEAMQRGIDFENMVTDLCNGLEVEENPWLFCAKRVASIVNGGCIQYAARKKIVVNGLEMLLDGRLDVLKAGHIYDIKFSKSYERGNYRNSTQHPAYFELIPEAQDFTYIVTDGNSVWTETYTKDESTDIKVVISDFLDWLNATGLMNVYKEHWEIHERKTT